MLRQALAGKAVLIEGSMEDQVRTFRQGKGRSASSASFNTSWREKSRRKMSMGSPKLDLSELSVASLEPKENVTIGFFLHTPFPSSEIFRILPVRKEILLGILHCNLIGFHTYDYARHFLSSCTRILGLQTMPNGASPFKRI